MKLKTGNKFILWLQKIEDTGRIVTIVAMTLIVFFQVAARIVFKWSSPALEEAARFIMIWSIFIGAVVTTRDDGHIKMGGFARSPKGILYTELAFKIITFVFLCIFVKWSYDFAAHSIRRNMNSIVLGVPLVVVHVCFLVTGVLMAFHTLLHLLDKAGQVISLRKGGDE